MRLGVFGGTFDPVHLAHLILAEQCREQARLDQVLFVPAPRPPHKRNHEMTRFDQRVEMLELAISGHAAFRIDQLEKDRPGPSFTYVTLQELAQRHTGAELFLIIGADSLNDLPQWVEPKRILELATLLVVQRPGWEMMELETLERSLALPEGFPLRLQLVQAPLVDIASRDIRARLAHGRSVRYLIPKAVEAYIADKGLYRMEQPAAQARG